MAVDEMPLERFGLVSVEALATMKGVTVRAAQRWVAAGLIPAVIVGGGNRAVYLIPKKAAERFKAPDRGRPRKSTPS